MRIAVVQHRLRDSAADDVAGLLASARRAAESGADMVIFPEVLPLHDRPEREELHVALDTIVNTYLMPHVGVQTRALTFRASEIPGLEERLGRVALFSGDAVMDEKELAELAAERPEVLVLSPRSESDLQAEAVLELAMGLSESVSGLVIVADPIGAEPGEPGHGGSAIVFLGELLAEAIEEDVIVADISEPMARLTSPEPVPEIPVILRQRLANHTGRKLDVDYLADLS